MKNIAILGGGIGGLCAAIGLQRAGHRVKVYESVQELKPLGAGLVLSANSVRALQRINLAQVVQGIGKTFDQVAILDQQGRTISETNIHLVANRYGAGNFSVHRADLQTTLLSQLASSVVQLGKKCTDMSQHVEGVTLSFEDGSQTTADALIAFDGIHSRVRQQLLPQVCLRYAGYTCWRAVVSYQFGHHTKRFSETWGSRGRFGIVPLTAERVYWFATMNAPRNDAQVQSYTVANLRQNFRGYHVPIDDILAHTADEQLLWNDILDFKPIERYAFGNVLLAGDAAHAMTPNLGQGAGMAIEDAAVITDCLTKYTSIEEAFTRFQQLRQKRVRSIVNTSFQLGRMAQLTNPYLSKLRNGLLRNIPVWITQQQTKSLYEAPLES